jgi:hypothetical protein
LLLSSFSKTSVGYDLTIRLDPNKLPSYGKTGQESYKGYESYDLAITFDPTLVKLANTSFDFPGVTAVNDTSVSKGVLMVSGFSSSFNAPIPATTPLVNLKFIKDGSDAFAVKVTKLNVNGISYHSDTSQATLTSPGNAITPPVAADTTPPTVQSSTRPF